MLDSSKVLKPAVTLGSTEKCARCVQPISPKNLFLGVAGGSVVIFLHDYCQRELTAAPTGKESPTEMRRQERERRDFRLALDKGSGPVPVQPIKKRGEGENAV